MAQVDSLRTHLVEELADTLDAERQLTKALPKMVRAATAPRLKQAFQSHLKETRRHITRVQEALRAMGERPKSKTCDAMEGLLTEGEEMINETPAGALRDAVMISAAQKVEHYEIATYGTARTFARVLGETRVVRLLEQTLKEEKAADVKLTIIAEGSVNARAAEQWESERTAAETAQTLLEQGGEWLNSAATSAATSARSAAKSARKAVTTLGRSASQPRARKSKKR
ncbi:MAG TPA: ferritin-like domain-containing protein [Vicinamibacterales bacterium]|nr:ferritin-like domain-containing protein [Vicinamibacterales bacterium]